MTSRLPNRSCQLCSGLVALARSVLPFGAAETGSSILPRSAMKFQTGDGASTAFRAVDRAADPRDLAAFCLDAAQLNADELEAMRYLIAKLLAGKAKHGPLDLDSDTRDMEAEELAEHADGVFYRAFQAIQRKRGSL